MEAFANAGRRNEIKQGADFMSQSTAAKGPTGAAAAPGAVQNMNPEQMQAFIMQQQQMMMMM